MLRLQREEKLRESVKQVRKELQAVKAHAELADRRLAEKEVALALPQGRVFVRFNVDQFMKTLIYHCFFPLSLPLVVWWDGYGMARNMLMTFSGFNVSHIINWSAQFTMLFANVVAAVAGLEPTLGGIFGLELVSARRRSVRC